MTQVVWNSVAVVVFALQIAGSGTLRFDMHGRDLRPQAARDQAKAWRGIAPLRSTRVDVEKLLGKPFSSHSSRTPTTKVPTLRCPNTDESVEAQLRLTTSVIEQRYSVEAGSRLLRLMLNLTYSNTGNRSILLDKNSSLVYRKLVSSKPEAVSESKYDYDESSSFIDVRSMQAAGMRLETSPEKDAFITLKPGESYSLKQEIILRLYDGTKDTENFLRPGTRFLQVGVATWYYLADPDTYRQQWQDEGYLWSQNITSVPMPLKVEKIDVPKK